MEKINWHEEPINENNARQPLGRLLVPVGQQATEEQPKMMVPVGQPTAEEPQKKKRCNVEDDKRKRRRFIIHIVILVVLLALIVLGIHDFLYEGPRQGVPQPKTSIQVDDESVSEE